MDKDNLVTLGIENDMGLIVLDRVESDVDAALLWYTNEYSSANSALTFVLSHENSQALEAVYEKRTNKLVYYYIDLDKLSEVDKIVAITDNSAYKFSKGELEEGLGKLIPIKDTNELIRMKDNYSDKVLTTPTYNFKDKQGKDVKVSLVLNKYGHRLNCVYIVFR